LSDACELLKKEFKEANVKKRLDELVIVGWVTKFGDSFVVKQ
jgi:hypothetical protein